MSKQRFRNIKQGKVLSQNKKKQKPLSYVSSRYKIKAFLTDAFMLLMPIMYLVFYLVMDGREEFSEHKLLGWVYILVPLLMIQTLFMYFTGQTPGYKAYNIKLIDEKTLRRPSFFAIVFRNIIAVFSFFSILGWMMMFFRKDSKTLHDILSATAVVYTDD